MAIFGRKVMNNRITILGIVVLFLLSLDVARIFYLQVLKGDEYAAKAESQQLSDTEIPAMRGTIYDSDGNILAQSATVWTVYLDPLNIKDKQRPVLIAELTKLFDLDEEEAKALEEKTRQKNHYVIVREQVENNIKKQLADFIDKQAMANCIGMEQSTKRYYPYGSLASSVIGFTGADDQGLSGLEQNYNDLLTGTPGRLITAKDAKSNSISDDYSTSIAAQDGDSLILTINQTIQYYLEKGLRETMEQYRSKGAYGVVMDCNTGAVLAMMEEKGATEEQAVDALFVAAAVGQAIATQASISGAEGGCQAECGSAAAMAAAALVYLEGGNPQQCADAAAFALMNLLGLVCDPVGGLVEVPCVYRNVGASGIAFTAADMALSGIRCPIEPDEVILAMKEVGDALPTSLRETGEGGCAACESICKRLHHKE